MAYLYPYGDSQQLNLSWFLAKFKDLYEYVMNLDPGEASMDTILSRFTNQYDPTTTYVAGDYCIFDGYIYKANQATSGIFNSGAWDPALPVNDIQGLRILISQLSQTVEDLGEAAVTNVQYTPGATTANGLLQQTVNGSAYTVMTVDKEPTENSQNPVKSGSVYEELTELQGSLNTLGDGINGYALTSQKLPASNSIFEYAAFITEDDANVKIIISNSGSGCYYSYGLYRNGTLVFGDGPVEDPVIWIGGNSTTTIDIPDNIVADTLQIRNRNGSANLTVAITKQGTDTGANTTFLDVGTGKQYTSLRTALEYAATIATTKNKVIVRFYGSGDYDVSNDITEADLTSSSTFNGLDVPPYTKLLGMGAMSNNKISLTLSSSLSSDIIYRISTINLYENAELENVWIYGNNVRYPCHDDFNTPNPIWNKKVIKNCRFTSDNSQQHRAYGAGYRSGMKWEFYDCTFELLEGASVGNPAFSAHNNSPMDKPSYLSFYKCNFQGGYGAGFGSLNRQANNAPSFIYFEGCNTIHVNPSVNFEVAMYAETNTGIETYMYGMGNNFTYSDVYINDHGGSGGTPSGTDYSERVNLNSRIISKLIELPTDTTTNISGSIILNKIGYITSVALTLNFNGDNIEVTPGGNLYSMNISSVFTAPQGFSLFGYSSERPIMGQYAGGVLSVRNMVRSFGANITTSIGLSGFYIGS